MLTIEKDLSLSAPALLRGGGSMLVIASLVASGVGGGVFYKLERTSGDGTTVTFALDRIGELIGGEPVVAIAFVLGSVVCALGALMALSKKSCGAPLLTLGFGFVTVPIIIGQTAAWTVIPDAWSYLLLPGVFLCTLSSTVKRDASRLPFLTLGVAVVLAVPVEMVLDVGFTNANFGVFLAVTTVLSGLAMILTFLTIEEVDSSLTAASVIVATLIAGSLTALPLLSGIGLHRGVSNPILVASVVMSALIVTMICIVQDWRTSKTIVSRRTLQIVWGLVMVSGWNYHLAQLSVDALSLSHPPFAPPTDIERLLWEPLATVTLIVFLVTLVSATWFTFDKRYVFGG